MKALVVIGYFLLNLCKGLASFFLSGGGVLFVAVASFATLCGSLYGFFQDNAQTVVDWANELSNIIQNFSDIGSNDISSYLVYACAVDTLLSWLTSFLTVFFTILAFVLFGIVSAFLGVVIPLVVFRVSYFIKSKIVSMVE